MARNRIAFYSEAELRDLDPTSFAYLGYHSMAYLKPGTGSAEGLWTAYAANGEELLSLEGKDAVTHCCIYNDLAVLSLH